MRIILYKILFTLFLGLLSSCVGAVMGQQPVFKQSPALYDLERLVEIKGKGINDVEVKKFMKLAEKFVAEEPVSVMDRKRTFSTNVHDYCSLSRYSWPSEKNANVYVIKDGQTNPEMYYYNRPQIESLSDRLMYLSVAYYLSNESKYYDAFQKQIRTWFVNEKTKMNPNMEYSQVQPGMYDNKGASYGLVEINHFTPVIESIYLIQCVNPLDYDTNREVRAWFASLLEWTLNNYRWEEVKKTPNNITSSLYVTFLEMARFTGNFVQAEFLSKGFTEKVLEAQIDDEGKQPAELKRVAAFGYSVGNTVHIIDFCLIMEQAGYPYYKRNQKKIDSAIGYLMQFVGNQKAFPYRQKEGWVRYENKLKRNVSRIKKLTSKRSYVSRSARTIKTAKESLIDYVYMN